MWFLATIIVNKTPLLQGLRNGCWWQGIWHVEKYTKKNWIVACFEYNV